MFLEKADQIHIQCNHDKIEECTYLSDYVKEIAVD